MSTPSVSVVPVDTSSSVGATDIDARARREALVNRPAVTHDLTAWVTALPDVAARLSADPIGEAGVGDRVAFHAVDCVRFWPAGLAEAPSAGLGTVLRSSTVHTLASQAGFRASVELPIVNDFFRFYRLDR